MEELTENAKDLIFIAAVIFNVELLKACFKSKGKGVFQSDDVVVSGVYFLFMLVLMGMVSFF